MFDTFFGCMPIKTGATVIGLIQVLSLIVCYILIAIYEESFMYFILPAVCFSITTLTFLTSCCARGSERDFSFRQAYYYAFIVCIPFLTCAYTLTLVNKYTVEFGNVLCFDNEECFMRFEAYSFSMWVIFIIFSVYFAFILERFRNEAILDEIDIVKFDRTPY